MLKQNGGGICDHEVGTGKTLIMCIAAHEMKRLNLAHKPMIIGLKANVAEIAATYQAAYPNARILYASEKDFSTANRVLGKIPQSPELQQRILQAELDTVEENLEVLRQQGKNVSRAMLKGLEKRKHNLEAKLEKVEHAIKSRTDDVVDFKQMGIMDEKSGMNFSEYMALLSGNTDLLDKAKLEKRIASLEGERKSFNKGKRDSEFKLESKTGELRNNTAFIDAMTEDWNRFLSVVQTDKEGNRLNIIKVDGVDSADEKVIGKRLQEIAKNATTGGLYTQVGELTVFR